VGGGGCLTVADARVDPGGGDGRHAGLARRLVVALGTQGVRAVVAHVDVRRLEQTTRPSQPMQGDQETEGHEKGPRGHGPGGEAVRSRDVRVEQLRSSLSQPRGRRDRPGCPPRQAHRVVRRILGCRCCGPSPGSLCRLPERSWPRGERWRAGRDPLYDTRGPLLRYRDTPVTPGGPTEGSSRTQRGTATEVAQGGGENIGWNMARQGADTRLPAEGINSRTWSRTSERVAPQEP
jgi:hypothetical protein